MITKQDIDNASMYINGRNVADYGVLVQSFKVGPTEVVNSLYQGFNRTNFNVLSTQLNMRTITVTLFYKAPTRRGLSLIKAKIDAMLLGKTEIWLPDGFFYTAVLTSSGDEQIIGVEYNEQIATCTYTLQGIRHDPLKTVQVASGDPVYCMSTIPRTDCRLTCTASQARASLQIGPVTITNVAKNDVLVADGITGRILQNGALCAGNMSFLHFPYLVPGENTITCPETLTVEYYPTY